MKYLISLILILLLIVVGVYWFVNRELTDFSVDIGLGDTAETVENSWKFAVIGDTEDVRPVTEEIISSLAEQDLAFVVHLGDVSSHGDAAEMNAVKELFDSLPFPTYYIPGNNDLVYDEALEIKTPEVYKSVFGDELWSSFNFENAHLVLLDNSYRRYGFPDEELEWLKTDLDGVGLDEADLDEANADENPPQYTFLFYHRPLDVPGQQLFGDDETPHSREQNEKFKTLISNYTITRIFNGHLHTTMSYTMNDIPVTVTGGGGALPQNYLGGEDAALFHYYIVYVPSEGDAKPQLERIEFK
ncbi:metallophosphoesterase family protein [Patescibacteria group bacterium]